MKTFKDIITEANVLWPGTPEYKKAFPDTERTPALGRGRRHDIKQTASGIVATRRYDNDETEKPEVAADGSEPVKRGRGRPPGKYGTYKKKVKEAFEVLDQLDTEEEVDQFLDTLDEDTLIEMSELVEEVELDEERGPTDKDVAHALHHLVMRVDDTKRTRATSNVAHRTYQDVHDAERARGATKAQAHKTAYAAAEAKIAQRHKNHFDKPEIGDHGETIPPYKERVPFDADRKAWPRRTPVNRGKLRKELGLEEVENTVDELDEAAKWRRDDLEGKTWRSRDWDDGEMSPEKIILGKDGKDVDNYDKDELSHRPGNYRSKADMSKRMTKKGVPTKSEISAQQYLKHMLKSKSKAGFGGVITGPKGKLPEEVENTVDELDEEQLDELSKGTVASYREKKGQRVMRDAMRAAVGDPTVKQPSDQEREMTKKNFDRAYDRLSGAKPTTPRKPFGAGAGNWVPRPGK